MKLVWHNGSRDVIGALVRDEVPTIKLLSGNEFSNLLLYASYMVHQLESLTSDHLDITQSQQTSDVKFIKLSFKDYLQMDMKEVCSNLQHTPSSNVDALPSVTNAPSKKGKSSPKSTTKKRKAEKSCDSNQGNTMPPPTCNKKKGKHGNAMSNWVSGTIVNSTVSSNTPFSSSFLEDISNKN